MNSYREKMDEEEFPNEINKHKLGFYRLHKNNHDSILADNGSRYTNRIWNARIRKFT